MVTEVEDFFHQRARGPQLPPILGAWRQWERKTWRGETGQGRGISSDYSKVPYCGSILLWWILVDLPAKHPFPYSSTSPISSLWRINYLSWTQEYTRSKAWTRKVLPELLLELLRKISSQVAQITQHLLMWLVTSATSQREPAFERSRHRWWQSQETSGERDPFTPFEELDLASLKLPHSTSLPQTFQFTWTNKFIFC